jgi:hypothetical protein
LKAKERRALVTNRHKARPAGNPDRATRDALAKLAVLMRKKVQQPKSPQAPVVIAVVGAGASGSAGLPLGIELKDRLRSRFLASPELHRLLNEEIEADSEGSRSADQIFQGFSLFEFAAVLTRFAYGRRVLEETIRDALRTPTHRPLAYELLAHLAKHRWIDHFIVLNFDTLLDGAVEDELPERIAVISSSRDLPAPGERRTETCFLVRPFGQLGRSPYSISTQDVRRFGPEAIAHFLHEEMPCPPGRRSAPVVLLLLGYAGAEPSFASFVRSLSTVPGTLQQRSVSLFVVDIAPRLSLPLLDLQRNLKAASSRAVVDFQHIATDADTAMEMLLLLLRWQSRNDPIWIPAARHLLLSKCCDYQHVNDHEKRFKLELMLQGVKSRGFIHLGAFSQVARLRRYGGTGVRAVIQNLLAKSIIKRDEWLGRPPRRRNALDAEYVPNYMIPDNRAVVTELFPPGSRQVSEWQLQQMSRGGTPSFRRRRIDLHSYVAAKLREIGEAPEIEIVPDVTPEAKWILGDEARPLESIQDLCAHTQEILKAAIDAARAEKEVEVYGIWSTGEWLFSGSGWARELGDDLLQQPTVTVHAIVTATGGVRGTRSERREEVITKLSQRREARVELKLINWWELNRVLTLVYIADRRRRGTAIYMQRRLSRPLVSPYLVDSDKGIKYLDEVWKAYYARAVTRSGARGVPGTARR